jgi:hypothetical protein
MTPAKLTTSGICLFRRSVDSTHLARKGCKAPSLFLATPARGFRAKSFRVPASFPMRGVTSNVAAAWHFFSGGGH